jgi:ribosomal protein S18 acetylase RimI-like enzyme
VRLRDARPAEGPALRDLTLASYEQYATTLGPLWPMYRDNITATLGPVTGAAQIVAERDGAIVGTVLLYPSGAAVPGGGEPAGLPEIRLLAVPPAERGRGIGEALVQECASRARAAGAAALTLHTTDMMQAAVRLYERLGFMRDPALDFSPAPGVTVKGYRLPLRDGDGTRGGAKGRGKR